MDRVRRQSFIRKIVSLSVALMLGGFVSTAASAVEQQGKPSGGKSRVYFLRGFSWTYSLMSARVTINGVEAGSVGNNSYLSVDRPAGRYRIEMRFGPATEFTQTIHIGAGQRYYFMVNMLPAGPVYTPYGPIFMPEAKSAGRPLPQKKDDTKGLVVNLGQLDARTGAKMIAQMTAE
jgi:hypothetical protein